jgi:aspartate/methionine/tyrosine aminotransferase
MKIPPFQLERYLALHEFTAPYLLCSSDCESVPVSRLLDLEPGARKELESLWLGYTESWGSPALREVIASRYESVSPRKVLVHTGAEEAIFGFMNALLSPGDHVIVHYPCYQSLAELPRTLGCEVTLWKADPQAGWDLDFDFLKRSLKPSTKAVILNSPHNPTGYLMDGAKYEAVVELLEKEGVTLFMDEVYHGLEYDPSERLPHACDLSETAVSLGVLSKSQGLAGLRIGWVASHDTGLLEEMAEQKDYTTICNSAPSEFLAALALRHEKVFVEANRRRIADNLRLLDGFFDRQKARLEWVRPKAGCIAFPRLEDGSDADGFCERILKQSGVLLAPGSKFGLPGPHFRIGYGRQSLPDSLARWEEALEA